MTSPVNPIIPPPPPVPREFVPQVVQVSAAQVWSAAAQNITIALGIVALVLSDKLSVEMGLPALLGVAGIDLFGRLKAKGSAAAALAVGSTGIIGHLPHMMVALAFGSTLFAGCVDLPTPKSGKDAAQFISVALDQAAYACSLAVPEASELKETCDAIEQARDASHRAVRGVEAFEAPE